MRFRISKTALHAPPRVQTAAELSELIGRSEEWILSRTHVRERRISAESMDIMAAKAVRQVLDDDDLPDMLVNASLTPIQLIPDSSVFIQRQLGWEGKGIPSFSVHATCMSFMLGLHTAGAMIQSGAYKRIVVVSSEQGSVCRDFDHPESAALIGDGAAAALVEATPEGEGSQLLAWRQTTWSDGADLAELRGCGTRKHPNHADTVEGDNLFRMRGPRIFKLAVQRVRDMTHQLLDEAGMGFEDIDLCVPHQASGPGLAAHSRFLDLPEEKVVNVVGQYGNCIAASIPMALAHAHAQGRLKRGDNVLMLGTGAGLHVAGMLLRW